MKHYDNDLRRGRILNNNQAVRGSTKQKEGLQNPSHGRKNLKMKYKMTEQTSKTARI